jgi:hypothetical protein
MRVVASPGPEADTPQSANKNGFNYSFYEKLFQQYSNIIINLLGSQIGVSSAHLPLDWQVLLVTKYLEDLLLYWNLHLYVALVLGYILSLQGTSSPSNVHVISTESEVRLSHLPAYVVFVNISAMGF